MRIKIFTLGLLLLSGCTGAVAFNSNLPDSEIGAMPPDAFGAAVVGEDPDIAAANAAEEAFAYPGEMQGRPAEMALAIASLDAMAGQFATGGRWLMMSDSAKLEMLGARGEVRAILGVPANADSQDVIDALVGAAQAIKRGDQNGAILALSGPEFARGRPWHCSGIFRRCAKPMSPPWMPANICIRWMADPAADWIKRCGVPSGRRRIQHLRANAASSCQGYGSSRSGSRGFSTGGNRIYGRWSQPI